MNPIQILQAIMIAPVSTTSNVTWGMVITLLVIILLIAAEWEVKK